MAENMPLAVRFVAGVDIENYGRRSAGDQEILQDTLESLLDAAARDAGLDRAQWRVDGDGDGERAELPPGADLIGVTGAYVRAFNRRLRRHNESHDADLELRVRMAMHLDVLESTVYGFAGPAHGEIARLLDARPLREALARSRASLALLVSAAVYRRVIAHDLGEIRAREFAAVRVTRPRENYDKVAYLHVPGHDMMTFAPAPADLDAAAGLHTNASPGREATSPSAT